MNSWSSLLAKQLTEQVGLIFGLSDTIMSIDRERDTSGAESINTTRQQHGGCPVSASVVFSGFQLAASESISENICDSILCKYCKK